MHIQRKEIKSNLTAKVKDQAIRILRRIAKSLPFAALLLLSYSSGLAAPTHIDEGRVSPVALSPIPPMFHSPHLEGIPSNTAAANDTQYDQIWSLVDRFFLYRKRLNGWTFWRHKFDGKMSCKAEFDSAVDEMLSSLNDQYTFFRDEAATNERSIEDKRTGVVSFRKLPRRLGYIHITTFCSSNCVQETISAVKKLEQFGCRDFLLDLRGNNGGTVDDASRVFSVFVKAGTFVSMSGFREGVATHEEICLKKNEIIRKGEGDSKANPRLDALAKNGRLLVLVDRTTKSAAEMLAGALRDNHRAHLIGSRTFGKGVVQRVWEFENGTSVKVTSAKFFLPGGSAINGVGVAPDLPIKASPRGDSQLAAAQRWFQNNH